MRSGEGVTAELGEQKLRIGMREMNQEVLSFAASRGNSPSLSWLLDKKGWERACLNLHGLK